MNTYANEMKAAMEMLAADPRTVFLGQAVVWPGTYMTATLSDVPAGRKIEMPVVEDMQMGISVGLALNGAIPVSIYPRWNFLLLAANQLVNHLDKIGAHVIVRVGVGSEKPLYPGLQHIGDYTDGFRLLLSKTTILTLDESKDILPAYRYALETPTPTILVEYMDRYQD